MGVQLRNILDSTPPQSPSPAGCRHAAEFASGWAEAPGYVPHRRCPPWRGRWQRVCRGRLPAGCRHAAGSAAVIAAGRKPPAMFRTEGARPGEVAGNAFAAAVCLPAGCRHAAGSAAVIAAGRKPPAMFRTEGARAGEVVGNAFAGAVCPQAAAMRLSLSLDCAADDSLRVDF